MKNPYEANKVSVHTWFKAVVYLSFVLWVVGFACLSHAQTASEKVSVAAGEVKEKVLDAGQAAASKAEQLWRRIEESRLKNRTPDEIVAWVIMGLLVGGLLYRTAGTSRLATFIFGLLGAFLGGIIAHVTQLDLGLGPVLIRYEDLLFSVVGGVVIVWAGRMFVKRKPPEK
jgi:uncharacterized membrane protein YeaQ/YmgE (transglycosylase-associated protein family)